MKTITIPQYNNPFIVIINNREYIYRGGDIVEVPDEVAEVIEDALELEQKPKRYLGMFSKFVEGSITELNEGDWGEIELISPYSFYNYNKLERIVIPNNISTIAYSAFRYCQKLSKVELHEGVKVLGERAFADCQSLTRVILKASTPPSISAETFLSVPSTCVFEVPAESLEAYKTASNWSALASKIVAIEE